MRNLIVKMLPLLKITYNFRPPKKGSYIKVLIERGPIVWVK